MIVNLKHTRFLIAAFLVILPTISSASEINHKPLPMSMTPIIGSDTNISSHIDQTPITESSPSSNSDMLSQIKKLQINAKPIFSQIDSEAEKEAKNPSFVYDGQTYQKNQIVSVAGGKIVLTPIESSIKKTSIILPPGLANISPDFKWVDYKSYLQSQKNIKKKDVQVIHNTPDGFYNNGKSKQDNYVDSFFDDSATTNAQENQDKSNIKSGLSEMLSSYGMDSTSNKHILIDKDQVNNKPVLSDLPPPQDRLKNVKEELNLNQTFNNVMSMYSNKDDKDTVGYLSNDNSKPTALRDHQIPSYLLGEPVYIRIFKSTNSLELYLLDHGQYKLANVYNICTFSGGLGPKKRQGDWKSPEGFYSFDEHSLNSHSEFDKSINTGFPNQYDREHGYTGSMLMIHGGCKSIGCYAMTDNYINEIYHFSLAALENGERDIHIDIFPFKMTDENLNKYKSNPNYPFWKSIQKGYQIFENTGRPPNVSVENGQYVFS